jgi:polyisoprenyl-phosphate glycosyltransferase
MNDYLISVIIPVYNEAKHIKESLSAITGFLKNCSCNYEIILVDDGSKDPTWNIIRDLTGKMPNLKAFRLSRNFGKEAALCAGIEAAAGDACIIMDADLQHPPELIPEMIRLWRDNGFDAVDGIKASRGKERIINKIGSSLFYSTLHRLSGYDLNGASDFKLLDRKIINAWKQMGERNTFFRGMTAWTGFNRTTVPFVVANRTDGYSKWSVLRLFKLAVTAITSFSSLPLQIVTFIGILFLLGSLTLGIQTLYMKFRNIAVSGFTTVILLLLIIGSALMISLGIIGTYVAKIFDEVKYRPRYIVTEMIDNKTLNSQ